MSRLFLSLFSGLLVVSAILVGGYWRDAYVVQPAHDAEEIAFVVEHGESVKAVAAKLKEQGLIGSQFAFETFVRLSDKARQVQAGTFALKPGTNFQDLVGALSNAASVEVQVTIPEGYTAAQIGAAVRQVLPHITEEEWNQAVGPNSPLMAAQSNDSPLVQTLSRRGLEGFLFPDTYRFHETATAGQVVARLYNTFHQRLEQAGIRAGEDGTVVHGLDPYQFVTLASIVEREVRGAEDMRHVAGIFLKRLDIGMALQADSTVNYVTGGTSPSITFAETELDTPYNTYKYKGLTPGPISNPGLDALKAVADPTDNPWYFFLTTPTGEVKYGRTFDEHIANRRFMR